MQHRVYFPSNLYRKYHGRYFCLLPLETRIHYDSYHVRDQWLYIFFLGIILYIILHGHKSRNLINNSKYYIIVNMYYIPKLSMSKT